MKHVPLLKYVQKEQLASTQPHCLDLNKSPTWWRDFFCMCVCVKEDKFVDHHFKLNFPKFAQIAHIEVITSNQLCNTM